MNGKQHMVIGAATGLALGYAVQGVAINFESIKSTVDTVTGFRPLVISAVIGGVSALIADIDSVKSKASQQFTRIATFLFWALVIVAYFKPESLQVIGGKTINIIKANVGMTLFVLNLTLGKMSPHRQYTHKIIGTSIFLVCAYMVLSVNYFIVFAGGYMSHILADKTTEAGLNFLNIKLPFMNKKNEVKIHF